MSFGRDIVWLHSVETFVWIHYFVWSSFGRDFVSKASFGRDFVRSSFGRDFVWCYSADILFGYHVYLTQEIEK
jgi:hypothetical protein